MIYYLLMILFLLVIGLLGYYAYFLLTNAGGSSLYNRIFILLFLTIIVSLLNFLSLINYKINFVNISINFNFYIDILIIIFTYNLFKVWEIRYNQLGKQNYQVLVLILTLLNLLIIVLIKNDMFFVSNTMLIANAPLVLNTLLLGVVNYLFYKDAKISKGSNFNYLYIVIFIILMTRIYQNIISLETVIPLNYYLVLLIQNAAYLVFAKITHDDFKKSFYY